MAFLHPAARLLFWLMAAVGLQWAGIPLLCAWSIFFLLSGAEARQHWRRLFWRTRFLLCTMFFVFAYAVPGTSLIGSAWTPSAEGVYEAVEQISRLVIFLGALAWLMSSLGFHELLSALWFLLRPLWVLGFPVDRSVVRLSLALEYVENPRVPAQKQNFWQLWRQWLDEGTEESAEQNRPVLILLPVWQTRDSVMIAFAVVFWAMTLFF
ncbi:MAG: energy-coupling factor transporter transmembrane protein EcfT [Zoogloeaceae bacterium]|nr:energy-coupling factor transporter transmembrane protein EcfT [Zoogloeaceae bacterium]